MGIIGLVGRKKGKKKNVGVGDGSGKNNYYN